jgi:hypothetical protein
MRRADGRRIQQDSREASDENFERHIMVMLFTERILGVLDLPGVNQTAAKAASFLEMFFTHVNLGGIMFFSTEAKED